MTDAKAPKTNNLVIVKVCLLFPKDEVGCVCLPSLCGAGSHPREDSLQEAHPCRCPQRSIRGFIQIK